MPTQETKITGVDLIKNSTPLLLTIKRVSLQLPARGRVANLCAFLREIRITLGNKTGFDQVSTTETFGAFDQLYQAFVYQHALARLFADPEACLKVL